MQVATRLGRVHVSVTGSGDPVVLWPSLLMDSSLWDAGFCRDHKVIAIDPPGHGRSSRLDRGFTFDECASVVVDVLDHLAVPRAHLVGNS
jgi:3-oxoadipate enol-lactonase